MTLTTTAATARIRRQLADAEAKVDQAMVATSELMASLISARAAADVPPHTGQAALLKLAGAQRSLLEGSSNIFRVHDAVSAIGVEYGILDEAGSTARFDQLDVVAQKTAA